MCVRTCTHTPNHILQRQVAILTAQVHSQDQQLEERNTQIEHLTTELRNAEKWRARVGGEFEECQTSLTAALKEAATLRQTVGADLGVEGGGWGKAPGPSSPWMCPGYAAGWATAGAHSPQPAAALVWDPSPRKPPEYPYPLHMVTHCVGLGQ